MNKKVAVIMGSDSDFPVVSAGIKRLKALDIPFEVHEMCIRDRFWTRRPMPGELKSIVWS